MTRLGSTLLFILLIACAGEGERFAEAELAEAEAVTWVDVESIFTTECSGCHDDPPKLGAPQSLKSYEEVIPWLKRIKVRSLEIGDMPPGGLRAEGAALLIEKWIMQGAPRGEELGGEEAGGEELGGEELGGDEIEEIKVPTWDRSIFQLFEIYCNTCHAAPPTGGAPFPLKTYEQASPLLDRYYERVIERQDMPPGGIRDEAHLEQILLWIEAGGPK